MVGITLSPEQVRAAPPEVRRWIELQIADSLGLHRPAPPIEVARHLIGCRVDDIRAVLGQIQMALPLVSVLFELAREPAVMTPQGMRVLQLDDMARHCRLQSPDQVAACLERINQVLQQVTGDEQATMTALDAAGHCVVADLTARSIISVWQGILSTGRDSGSIEPGVPVLRPTPEHPAMQPYAISVPPSAVTVGPAPT